MSDCVTVICSKDTQLHATSSCVTQSHTTSHHLVTESHSSGLSGTQQDPASHWHGGESSAFCAESDSTDLFHSESTSSCSIAAATQQHSSRRHIGKQVGKVTCAVWITQTSTASVAVICTRQWQGVDDTARQQCVVGTLSTAAGTVSFKKKATN